MEDAPLFLTRRDFVGAAGVFGLAANGNLPLRPVISGGAAAPNKADTMIERAFLRLNEGLIHYRSAGTFAGSQTTGPLPLYMAHAGPGSSLGMEGLMSRLAPTRFCIAPDMLGNGDSAAPATDSTTMEYYAGCAVRMLDALKIERVDFYGSHTGAQIAIELAVKWPDRVGRLVLDGMPLFANDLKRDLLANYAPAVQPDEFGGHLLWAWNFVRDQFLFWPHYAHDVQHRLPNGLLSPRQLHLGVVDVLKALDTYRIAYQAAFAQDVRGLVPRIRAPVLFTATERDPLHTYLEEVAALLPGAKKLLFPREAVTVDRAAAIQDFLDARG
jgi:pimeloyl-ACP methyl ester carboxylesterase